MYEFFDNTKEFIKDNLAYFFWGAWIIFMIWNIANPTHQTWICTVSGQTQICHFIN